MNARLSIVTTTLGLAALAGCNQEQEKLGADCTEVGSNGAAHGLGPCLELAAKYPSASDGGLEIAWSGIQMHCSFDDKLSASRQKECDAACVSMKTFSDGQIAPDGLSGTTYVRRGLFAGECVVDSSRSGGSSVPGVSVLHE